MFVNGHKGHHSDGWKGGGMLLGIERKGSLCYKMAKKCGWIVFYHFFVEGQPFNNETGYLARRFLSKILSEWAWLFPELHLVKCKRRGINWRELLNK